MAPMGKIKQFIKQS